MVPIILIFLVAIIFVIYVAMDKKDIYIKSMEINLLKILNIKISNKEKCFGKTVKSPKHFKKI